MLTSRLIFIFLILSPSFLNISFPFFRFRLIFGLRSIVTKIQTIKSIHTYHRENGQGQMKSLVPLLARKSRTSNSKPATPPDPQKVLCVLFFANLLFTSYLFLFLFLFSFLSVFNLFLLHCFAKLFLVSGGGGDQSSIRSISDVFLGDPVSLDNEPQCNDNPMDYKAITGTSKSTATNFHTPSASSTSPQRDEAFSSTPQQKGEASSGESSANTRRSLSEMKVLVVDDSAICLRVIANLLRNVTGCHTDLAENGLIAINYLKSDAW